MAFPQVAAEVGGNEAVDDNSKDVTLPSGIVAGDLLLILMAIDGTPTSANVNIPSGWSRIPGAGNTAANRLDGFYRVADGSEGATVTVTFQAGTNEMAAWRALRITGADSASAPEAASGANTTTANPNPSSTTASWGAEDTLWLAVTSYDNGTRTITAYPASYTDGTNDRANNSAGAGIGIARRERNIATEDPGTFTLSAADDARSATLAIRPGTGQTISPSGIASAEAVGGHAVTTGPVTVSPGGIASAETIGSAVVSPGEVSISPGGIASGEAFGTPTVSTDAGGQTISPSGIASAEAAGTPQVTPGGVTIAPTGIPSSELAGTPTVTPGAVTVAASGISSGELFGTPTVTPGSVTISPSGLASAEQVGTPTVTSSVTLSPIGVPSGEAVGTPTVTPGSVTASPTGVPSGEAFGNPTLTIVADQLYGEIKTGRAENARSGRAENARSGRVDRGAHGGAINPA